MTDKPKHQLPTYRGKPIAAIMSVDKGEEVAGAWVTPAVPGVGFYKLLAKRLADGSCEWVHFTQRADGSKDKFYRGTVESVERLADVMTVINNSLATAYGPTIRLMPADADVHPVDGVTLGQAPTRIH
ncbi:MAG: hypothetical protein QG637_1151 [Chloroflexota bacterium]|nr:hypothetical protein [Chloroflexota bacterium]